MLEAAARLTGATDIRRVATDKATSSGIAAYNKHAGSHATHGGPKNKQLGPLFQNILAKYSYLSKTSD